MEKNEQQMPRLGEPVPAFEAMTTKGKISFPDDYKGKWVILFSHPADFTPICTTEILTFGARTEEFRALNCELVGLSVDSRNSHIAWLKTIREKIEYKGMKDVKVGFPIIDDVAMKVASLYGMIQPGESQTAAVRAVRQEKGIAQKDTLRVLSLNKSPLIVDTLVEKLAGVESIEKCAEKPSGAVSFLVRTEEYFIPLGDKIDREAELEKLRKELEYTEGFLTSVRKKLSNERFVGSAPEAVVAAERKKEADALSKIDTIKQAIDSLS